MNNFINSRVEGFNNTKIQGMYEHALRIVNSRNQKNNNQNVVYDVATNEMIKVVYISRKDLKLLSENKQIKYKQDRKKLLHYFKGIKENYNLDRVEHNQLFKARRKKNLQDDCGSHAEGVLTFSEQIREDYNSGKLDVNEFMKRGLVAAEESVQYLNEGKVGKLINVTLHLDEKTPHFHYTFKNYDDNGRSLTHKENIKKKGLKLEHLQDIATKHFEKDFGIKRGISKEIKGDTRHQKTSEYYEKLFQEKNLEIKSLKRNIDDMTTKHQNVIDSLKSEISSLKDERESVTNDVSLSKEEKKQIHKEISSQQKLLRESKSEVSKSNTRLKKIKQAFKARKSKLEDFDKSIENIEQEVETSVFTLEETITKIYNKHKKTMSFDNDSFFSELSDKFSDLAMIKYKNSELDRENKQMKSAIDKVHDQYSDKIDLSEKVVHLESQLKEVKSYKASNENSYRKQLDDKDKLLDEKRQEISDLKDKYEPRTKSSSRKHTQ